jgi:chromatin assembly factor 1 subunit A
MTWSTESVSAKIKLLSKRKAYFDPIKQCTDVVVDLFEDNNQDRLWRWEVTTLDLLDSDVGPKARKARTARKKISSYQSALLKLVKSLEEIEKKILDPALPKLDKAKAKISLDEERVLKFERDAEKQRLAEEAKARKLLELAAKKKAREEALETKRRKKEEEIEMKKAAALAREDEKRKKEEEKLQKEEEKKRQERKKKEKQKGIFRSFFAAPKKEENNNKKTTRKTCRDITTESFNAELFRSKVNASTDVLSFSMKGQKRSASAMASRKRRTKMVSVSVYKTVIADDVAWGTSPEYLEQRTIKIPNKYRFLNFHEDCRPAYRGTWTKKSSIVTGKNPFRKDSSIFDYEYDSEAEWEEGDDEMGENVEDDTKNQDEEMDGEGNATKVYDFDDGFCVADDRLLDNEEDADDDTRALYKKKMDNREHEQHMHSNRVRIIAPGFGGVPLHLIESRKSSTDYVEGFDKDDVTDVLSSYKGIQLSHPKFCLDAFPQLHVKEENRSESNTKGDVNKDDYSVEAMITLARFSHHSTHTSKDKLIEELRTLHPTLFFIRAKATRKLDAIAMKKKHPKFAGVYWEVKTEILIELGLTDIMVCCLFSC